jgi:hypothetical protein
VNRTKAGDWIIVGSVVAVSVAVLLVWAHHWAPRQISIRGAVIRRDVDPRKQLPIPDVVVTASNGVTTVNVTSDATGYFKIVLPAALRPEQTLTLAFHHDEYKPLLLKYRATIRSLENELYVEALEPLPQETESPVSHTAQVVSNIRIRYTYNTETDSEVGSAVNTFQVVNKPNIPCNHQEPCSPDGRWKASSGSISMDAGAGNEFGNVRASCIAGPCPFTRIDDSRFKNGGREITASAIGWSSTATFLVEAEVFHPAMTSGVRESYPVIFGRDLNFTVPPTQEGVSIEAEISGAPMVFPLGPELYLSWATCTASKSRQGDREATAYSCELKPGYRF